MLVGLKRTGKSTLADLIEGEVSDHRHREDCYFRTRTFEVPGGYVENHWMAKEVIMLGHNQACSQALLLDGSTLESLYSAGYARAFTIPTLGVITKCEGLGEEERQAGVQKLTEVGCREILCLSAKTGEGIDSYVRWVWGTLPDALRFEKQERR